jgi:hypothetical protein
MNGQSSDQEKKNLQFKNPGNEINLSNQNFIIIFRKARLLFLLRLENAIPDSTISASSRLDCS